MKKLVLAAAFALFASAGACPNKPGYIVNGLTRMPTGLYPECGANYDSFSRGNSAVGIKWVELYRVSEVNSGMKKVVNALSKKHYLKVSYKDYGNYDMVMAYKNIQLNKVVVVQIFVFNDDAYMGISGN
jgi:hypothetical protein